ncbi:beta-hexosaminidase [[Candida] jaroonii]|uniref:Beta-hexosaminidase n=1 Tax=[Candida] jaroonii TaxID=467808 RepID=A0ACA9YAS6_9ASCO|nr:beta-hexosaminidase [[Candida] jaroonii]
MKLLSLFYISKLACGILVNPLPKPVSIEWNDEGQKKFNTNIELVMDKDDDIVFEQFYKMIDTIKSLEWFPAATESPKAEYPPVPTGPPSNLTKRQSVESIDNELDQLRIKINDMDADLQFGVNESYHLVVSDNILIESETIWGSLHALKTLQQLVIYEDGDFKIESGVEIYDEPILSHRGVLIDSGRNFLSLEVIKENIDLMSLAKLNTLHWHLEDTASWPLEIKAYPEMILDSYSAKESYSQSDIKEVINYARRRGVRILPEIDLPGHANAGWKQINESLVTCGSGWWSAIAAEPPPGQLDISQDETYEMIEKVFDELNELFPDTYFHVGHDELNPSCYNFSSSIYEWYEENNGTFYDLVQYWVDRSIPIFTKNDSTRLVMWQDIVTSENATIPKDKILIQNWLGSESIKEMASQGYDLIVSSSDHYYLDCGFGGWVTNNTKSAGSWCDPYKNWQNIYSFDFYANLTDSEKDHIVGAEVALWSEMVDSTNLITKIWSRSAAFAEASWSGNKENDEIRVYDLTQRIFNYREYLVALGYDVDPLAPQYCWKNPHSCDISLE